MIRLLTVGLEVQLAVRLFILNWTVLVVGLFEVGLLAVRLFILNWTVLVVGLLAVGLFEVGLLAIGLFEVGLFELIHL